MNYKKLISSRLSNFPTMPTDKSGAIVGLLAGLAVGAVIGVLFAPDSGKRTRERISDKALDLADNVKDGFHSIKDNINNGKQSLGGLKNQVVDNVKTKVNSVSQEFKEFRDTELEKAKSAIKNTADDANDAIQTA
jgi:gas vesicle protein